MPAPQRKPAAPVKTGTREERLPANLHHVQHDLIEHKLTRMRNKTCLYDEFRRLMREVGLLMGAEVTRELGGMTPVTIETPLAKKVPGRQITRDNAVIVPILRSGAIFAESLNLIMNAALFGHIGLHRETDASTSPQVYMIKLPPVQNRTLFLAEPIIATGLTADAVIYLLEGLGATEANDTSIVFMSLLVGRKAIYDLAAKYPRVQFYFAAIDDGLTDKGYLVPGLGDVGERLFGTNQLPPKKPTA